MTQQEDTVSSTGRVSTEATDNAAYHALTDVVSKSHLDLVARSPKHYWARFLDPDRIEHEPTAAMQLGTAVHTYVLELDQWDARYFVAPEKVNRTTKAGKETWAAYQAEANGREILSRDDFATVLQMSRGIYSHPVAAMLLGKTGQAEGTYMWSDDATGLRCKCRPDYLLSDGSVIVDLKTTEDASPEGFRASIGRYRYFVQSAWYLAGLEKATGKRPEKFVFVAVEKKPPYVCGVYEADAQMIEIGWEVACRDLARIAECRAANSWPGYSEQLETISLPPWMRPRADGVMPTIQEIQGF